MKKLHFLAICTIATFFTMTSCSKEDETPLTTPTNQRSAIAQDYAIYGLWQLEDESRTYFMKVEPGTISTGNQPTRFNQTYSSISILENEYVTPGGLVYKFNIQGDKLMVSIPNVAIWQQQIPEVGSPLSTLTFKKANLIANPLEGVWQGTNTGLFLWFTSDFKFSYGNDPMNFAFTNIPYTIDSESQFSVTYEDGRIARQKFTIDGKNMTIDFLDQAQNSETYFKIY